MLTPLSFAQRDALTKAAQRYYATVAQAGAYLRSRGIDGATAQRYGLGFVADPLPEHEQVRDRLAIPYITPAGVVDIRFRCLADHDCKEVGCPKYIGSPGRAPSLFNVGALQRAGDTLVLCEGELDTIVMDALVGVPAIGVPGASSWQGYWARLLDDYARVIVACDGDDAGHGLGRTIVRQVEEARVVHLPPGTDVNSLFLAVGEAGVKERLGL